MFRVNIQASGDCAESAWVSSYRLSYKNSTIWSRLYQIINPETDSFRFNGITDVTLPIKPSFFQPVVVSHVRIYPMSWVTALVLRWEIIFCQSMNIYSTKFIMYVRSPRGEGEADKLIFPKRKYLQFLGRNFLKKYPLLKGNNGIISFKNMCIMYWGRTEHQI